MIKPSPLSYQVVNENGNHFLHAYADQQAVRVSLLSVFPPREFFL